jgi:hypothetical protein
MPSGADRDLERRVARLESERSGADTTLRIQLQHERRLREQLLEDREREVDELVRRLESAESALAATRIGEGKAIEIPLAQSAASEPASDSGSTREDAALAALPAVSAGAPVAERAPEPAAADAPEHQAMVKADLLWVRAEPGVSHAKVSALSWGTLVELDGATAGEWTRIRRPTVGWVASRYLEPAEAFEFEPGDPGPDA